MQIARRPRVCVLEQSTRPLGPVHGIAKVSNRMWPGGGSNLYGISLCGPAGLPRADFFPLTEILGRHVRSPFQFAESNQGSPQRSARGRGNYFPSPDSPRGASNLWDLSNADRLGKRLFFGAKLAKNIFCSVAIAASVSARVASQKIAA